MYLRSLAAYELEIAEHHEVDPADYYTMSRAGVTHFLNGETDFITLSQWEREYFLYTRMMKVRSSVLTVLQTSFITTSSLMSSR